MAATIPADHNTESHNACKNRDIAKSRAPCTFCDNVNITASALSRGKVRFSTGIPLIRNPSKTKAMNKKVTKKLFILSSNIANKAR